MSYVDCVFARCKYNRWKPTCKMSARPCKFNCHVNLVNRFNLINRQPCLPMSNGPTRRARASDENEQETATLSLFIVSASLGCEACDNLLSILRNTSGMNDISGQNIETIDNTKFKSSKEISKSMPMGLTMVIGLWTKNMRCKQQMKSFENFNFQFSPFRLWGSKNENINIKTVEIGDSSKISTSHPIAGCQFICMVSSGNWMSLCRQNVTCLNFETRRYVLTVIKSTLPTENHMNALEHEPYFSSTVCQIYTHSVLQCSFVCLL